MGVETSKKFFLRHNSQTFDHLKQLIETNLLKAFF